MSDVEKKLIEFRTRIYAMARVQASLENISIVELIEKAIENYASESVKMMINSEYGEWQDRPKKTGRPKVSNKTNMNSNENIEKSVKVEVENAIEINKRNTTNTNNTTLEENALKVNTEPNNTIYEDEVSADIENDKIIEYSNENIEESVKKEEVEEIIDEEITDEEKELLDLYSNF